MIDEIVIKMLRNKSGRYGSCKSNDNTRSDEIMKKWYGHHLYRDDSRTVFRALKLGC